MGFEGTSTTIGLFDLQPMGFEGLLLLPHYSLVVRRSSLNLLSSCCPGEQHYGRWSPALSYRSQDKVGKIMGKHDCLEWVGHHLCCILCSGRGGIAVMFRMLRYSYFLLSTFLASGSNVLIQHVQYSASTPVVWWYIWCTTSTFRARGCKKAAHLQQRLYCSSSCWIN